MQLKSRVRSILFESFIGLIAGLVIFSFGFLTGRGGLQDHRGIVNTSQNKPKLVDFSLFWQAWNNLENNYVGKLDEKKMVDGAISGMMNSLDDPYTVFLPSDINSQFKEDMSGHFEGVGIEVALKDGLITVVSPLAGSPAEKAGIKALDEIVAVNSKPTDGLVIDDVVKMIRGKSKTEVTLTIRRADIEKPFDVKIFRDTIYVKSVQWEIKPNNIGYIKMSQFGEDTLDLFQQSITEMNKKKIKGVIIDLRNDPGGLLDVAIDTTSLVIKPGIVVKRKYKDGHTESDKTTFKPLMLSPKMVVLVNGGSASASEIFAGAIQDTGRGTIVGEKTFGKGSVQDLTELSNGASMKVTIAKWLTPKGRVIDGKGITPDVIIAEGKDESNDLQLQKALEILEPV